MCICTCVGLCIWMWCPEEGIGSPGAGVTGCFELMWVLGIKLRFSGRAVCILNLWIISPALWIQFLKAYLLKHLTETLVYKRDTHLNIGSIGDMPLSKLEMLRSGHYDSSDLPLGWILVQVKTPTYFSFLNSLLFSTGNSTWIISGVSMISILCSQRSLEKRKTLSGNSFFLSIKT